MDSRKYPDRIRAICDEHGFIEHVHIGGPEPLSSVEVEYVRADLHRGTVELRDAARKMVQAWERGDGERTAMAGLMAVLDAFGGQ